MTVNNESIVLDVEEANELLFKVKVEGTDPSPAKVRLVCEGSDGISFMFNGKSGQDDIVQFVIPAMDGKIKEGHYTGSVEVLVENRCFVPVKFNIDFKKTVKVMAEVFKPSLPPPQKVTVTATPIVAKKVDKVVQEQRREIPEPRHVELNDNPSNEDIREWAKAIVNSDVRAKR